MILNVFISTQNNPNELFGKGFFFDRWRGIKCNTIQYTYNAMTRCCRTHGKPVLHFRTMLQGIRVAWGKEKASSPFDEEAL